MALSAAKLVCFLFLLTLFSVQIHARESQFFSKVPSSNGTNNVQVTATDPNKEEQSLSKQQQEPNFVPETEKTTTLNYQTQQQQQKTFGKQQQDPTFIPETQNGYGLYGQENNQFPTTTSETVKYEPYTTPITSTASGSFEPYTTPSTSNDVKYEPYTTPITSTASGSFEPYTTPTTSNDVKYEPYTTPITSTVSGSFEPYNTPTENTVNYEPYTTPTTSRASNYAPYTTKAQTPESYNNNNNNNYYYNKNAFGTEQENQGDSKFQQSGYTNLANKNAFYNGVNNNGYNNVEKQGMSDTRFLENGRYYHDVQNEQNYHPYQFQQNSREVASGNGYNTKAQTPESYYNDNNNYYYNKNAFGTEQENQGDSKFQQSSYTNLANKNAFYNGVNNNGYNNVEKQGMSDTRFLENGRYYHDVQNEQNYHPYQYQQNSRKVASGNGYNSRGYNANNENSYEHNNSMEGYQKEENEFDELQD